MVKPQDKLGVELDRNDITSEVNQKVWLLETSSYNTEKGELTGPKTVQPPQGKTHHIKPVKLGGGAKWPSKPTTTTSSKGPGSVGGDNLLQDKDKTQLLGGVELGLPLEGMVVEEMVVMVMMGLEMMMMKEMMMMRRMKMTKILKQLLKVKMGKNKMHQEEEVVEVMNHHLIQGVEMWDLEVKGDIEVKEDGEVGQVHKVYQVHRDLRALRV